MSLSPYDTAEVNSITQSTANNAFISKIKLKFNLIRDLSHPKIRDSSGTSHPLGQVMCGSPYPFDFTRLSKVPVTQTQPLGRKPSHDFNQIVLHHFVGSGIAQQSFKNILAGFQATISQSIQFRLPSTPLLSVNYPLWIL